MEGSELTKANGTGAPIQVYRIDPRHRPGERMRNLVGLTVPEDVDAAWRRVQQKRLDAVQAGAEANLPPPSAPEYERHVVDLGNDITALGERYASMAPPGSLRLEALWGEEEGTLLEDARFKYAIPDGCFTTVCEYDWIHLFCIPEFDQLKLNPGTHIERTASQEDAAWLGSSRGVIVSAGLKALYELRSHGMGVGHVVGCVRPTPYRKKADIVQGKPIWLTLYRAGDIHESETTLALLMSGALVREFDAEVGYIYKRPGQEPLKPAAPFAAEDQ